MQNSFYNNRCREQLTFNINQNHQVQGLLVLSIVSIWRVVAWRALWFYGPLWRSWRLGAAQRPPLDLCYRPAAIY